MTPLDIARWQFGITTVYHFLFVPLTISLTFIVAGLQTRWYRSGDEGHLRVTRFFGELLLINFAMGVVTGIVQEFQFGMNWSEYSRFVGDIFGAPLAIEGLLAFFLESVWLGVWIFGWGRLPKALHLASIWIVAVATALSAFIILAANAWMQQPVGYVVNNSLGRAELKDFIAVLTNPTVVLAFPHVMAASFMTGGAFVLGISLWRIVRRPDDNADAFRSTARAGAAVLIVASLFILITGDQLGKHITTDQPMKLAAAEDLRTTTKGAPFSLFTLWDMNGKEVFSLEVPNVLSILATNDPNGTVQGIDDLQAQYRAQYGPGDYSPIVPVTFYSFRFMIGAGSLAVLAAIWLLWRIKGRRTPGRWAVLVAVLLPFLPLAANSFAWIFTEMGRQPWIVQGQMLTSQGVSPNVGMLEAGITVVGFTLLYGVLAVIEVWLLKNRIGSPLAAEPAAELERPASEADRPTALAY